MSFDIALAPSTLTPSGSGWADRVREVLDAVGAQRLGDGVDVRLSSGVEVELYDGGDEPGAMIALRDFDTATSEFLFLLAAGTQCFVVAPEVDAAFRMPGNTGEPPEGLPPVVTIDSPDMLAKQLHGDFEAWSDYRDQIVSSYDPKPPAPDPKHQSFFSRLFGGGKT